MWGESDEGNGQSKGKQPADGRETAHRSQCEGRWGEMAIYRAKMDGLWDDEGTKAGKNGQQWGAVPIEA